MRQRVWFWVGVMGCLGAVATGCARRAVMDGVVEEAGVAVLNAAPHIGTEPPAAAEGFTLPRDEGGAVVGKFLPPENTISGPGDRRTAPMSRPAPRFLDVSSGATPVSPGPGLVPPLAAKTDSSGPRPALVTEELPPAPLVAVSFPEMVVLPTTERAKADSIDVHQPTRLPVLAQSVAERATLEDVTADASTSTVLSAQMPLRMTTVPFFRLAIPDPFENRRALTLVVPPEPSDPIVGSPALPKP